MSISLKRKGNPSAASDTAGNTKAVKLGAETSVAKGKLSSAVDPDEPASSSKTAKLAAKTAIAASTAAAPQRKVEKLSAFGAVLGSLIKQTKTTTPAATSVPSDDEKQTTTAQTGTKSASAVTKGALSGPSEKFLKAKQKAEAEREIERKRKAQGLAPLKTADKSKTAELPPSLLEAKLRQAERKRYKQRKLLLAKDHVNPEFTEHEKSLLRIATKGMVTLFNAVAQQQRKLAELAAKSDLGPVHHEDKIVEDTATKGLAAKLREKASKVVEQKGEQQKQKQQVHEKVAQSQRSKASALKASSSTLGSSDDDDSDSDNMTHSTTVPLSQRLGRTQKISDADRQASGTGWKVFDEDYLLKKKPGWADSDSDEDDD